MGTQRPVLGRGRTGRSCVLREVSVRVPRPVSPRLVAGALRWPVGLGAGGAHDGTRIHRSRPPGYGARCGSGWAEDTPQSPRPYGRPVTRALSTQGFGRGRFESISCSDENPEYKGLRYPSRCPGDGGGGTDLCSAGAQRHFGTGASRRPGTHSSGGGVTPGPDPETTGHDTLTPVGRRSQCPDSEPVRVFLGVQTTSTTDGSRR